MSRKVLFVGVGGSGSKTLSFLKQSLQFRLEAAGGDPRRLPRAWQFLAIDLPPAEQQISGVPRTLNGESEYLGIAPDGKFYPMYDSELMDTPAVRGDFNRWRLLPMEVNQLPWLGAGQRRAVGRVAVVSQVNAIRNRVGAAQNVLGSADTNREFLDLPGAMAGRVDLEPLVIVVGSLTGGTGSGALLDVSRIVEAQLREDVMLLAYLPSVFDNLAPNDRSGMPGNTYFAMSEMLNAIWDRGGDSSYLVRAGMNPFVGEMTGRGPAYPIAVGRGGSGGGAVSLNSDIQVYQAMSELLSELILDDSYSTTFEAQIVNVYANPPVSMNSPLLAGARMPFVSLGFSRFGLGRARFGRYCAERMARTTLYKIANGHLALARERDSKGGLADLPAPDAGRAILDRDRAEAVDPVVTFAKACGMSELGAGNDQVIDFIAPQQAYLDGEATLLGQVVELVRQGPAQRRASDWLRAFVDQLNLRGSDGANESSLLEGLVQDMDNRCAEWAAEVPEKFRSEITRVLLTKGGWYALALCQALDAHLSDAVQELEGEAMEKSRLVDGAMTNASAAIRGVGDSKAVSADHPGVRKAWTDLVADRIGNQFAVQRRSRAIALLSSFQTAYLRRFSQVLESNLQGLNRVLNSEEFTDLSAEEPSLRLHTPPTEFLVLEVDEYQATFDELVDKLLGGRVANPGERVLEALFDDSRVEAASLGRVRFVDLGPWRYGTDGPEAKPIVDIHFGVQRFLDRAYSWFVSEGNALSTFINSDIVKYVEDSEIGDQERQQRIERLVSVFRQALAAAQPLVDVDQAVLQTVTNASGIGGGMGSTLSMSALPFAQDSAAGRAFAKALQQFGVDETALAGKFATAGVPVRSTDTINIASNSKALHPVCLVDYQRAVAERWTEERAGKGGSFGTHRRTLRRAEAVPLPRESMVLLSAGWDVSRALGMVKVDAVSADGSTGPFRPSVLRDGAWLQFPDQSPEGPAAQPAEGFAVMLESFGLAQLVGALDARSLDSYEALLEIGRSACGNIPDGPLRDWILQGQLPAEAAVELVPGVLASAGESFVDRQAAMMSWLASERGRQLALSEVSPTLEYADRVHDFAELRSQGIARLLDALTAWTDALDAAGAGGPRTAGGSHAAD